MWVEPTEKPKFRICVPAVDPRECRFVIMGTVASAMDFGNVTFKDRDGRATCDFVKDDSKCQSAMKKFGITAEDFDAVCACLDFALYNIPCKNNSTS